MSSGYELLTALLVGFFLLPPLLTRMSTTLLGRNRHEPSLYKLDQVKLNIPLAASSYWMNMGFWTPSHDNDFPAACRRLLLEMLAFAGIDLEDSSVGAAAHKQMRILDVGIGCGDQSICLLGAARRTKGDHEQTKPLVKEYIGITNVKLQADIASRRTLVSLESSGSSRKVQIVCEDAAKPEKWRAIPTEAWEGSSVDVDTWVLGLDCLYHLSPSRERLLRYANRELHASLAAFDLMLSPDATWLQRLMLRVLCPFLGAPFGNICTQATYKEMLVRAGYSTEGIAFRDVSSQVFQGLAAFLHKRDRDLADVGLGGLGRLRGAKWLFQWWARSKCVQGVLVVARTRPHAGVEEKSRQ